MNNPSETTEQDLLVDPPARVGRNRRGVLDDIRPMLPSDAQTFETSPETAYIVRPWSAIDDRNGLEHANLHDMWGVVIVFPNGLHMHCWYAIPSFGSKPVELPADRAEQFAKILMDQRPDLQQYASRGVGCVADAVKNYGHSHDPRRFESARRGRRMEAL